MEKVLKMCADLHDGLSDMIESGRLRADHIPDDYQWLVETLVKLGPELVNVLDPHCSSDLATRAATFHGWSPVDSDTAEEFCENEGIDPATGDYIKE
jgi:hypothetical protein